MTPITIPIIITIAVIGIIAIVLVKLFYKDEKTSDLSDELPPIVAKHWEDTFNEPSEKDYSIVTKSWEEPMNHQPSLKNGIASKVFQEPMTSKHKDIINKDSDLSDDTITSLSPSEYENSFDKNNDNNNDKNYLNEDDGAFTSKDFNQEYGITDFDLNENKYGSNNETNDQEFKESKFNQSEEIAKDYITPKKYQSSNDNINTGINDYTKDDYFEEVNTPTANETNDDSYYKDSRDLKIPEDLDNYNDYNYDNHGSDSQSKTSYKQRNLNNFDSDVEGLNMGEHIIIGGESYTINIGDDVIFNHNGEAYSSRILDMKHENIKIKYRAQEKWINFSDIKKVL